MDHGAWDPRRTRPSSVELCFDTVFGDVGGSLLVQVQGATAERRDADVHILRGIAESPATELLHIQARQEARPAQAFQQQRDNASLNLILNGFKPRPIQSLQVDESGEVDADPSRSKCASCGQRLMVGSCFIRKQALTSESRTANMAS